MQSQLAHLSHTESYFVSHIKMEKGTYSYSCGPRRRTDGENQKKKNPNKKVNLNRFIVVNISYPLHTDISSALVKHS